MTHTWSTQAPGTASVRWSTGGASWSRQRSGPCTPGVLELLYSARGGNDYRVLAEDLGWFPHLAVDARVELAALRASAIAGGTEPAQRPHTDGSLDCRRGRGARRHVAALRPALRPDRVGDGPEDRVAGASRDARRYSLPDQPPSASSAASGTSRAKAAARNKRMRRMARPLFSRLLNCSPYPLYSEGSHAIGSVSPSD